MNKANDALECLKKPIFYLKEICTSSLLTKDIYSKILKDTAQCIELVIQATNNPAISKKDFIDKNAGILFKIHDYLVGQFAKTYLSKKNIADARSIHDRLFNSLKIRSPVGREKIMSFLSYTFNLTYS